MKLRLALPALSLALFACSASAQAPAGAPAGANGLCKDGTYSMAASKSGACGGHKGVQTWFGAATTTAKAAPAAKPAPAAPTAVAPAPAVVAKPAVAASDRPTGGQQPPAAAANIGSQSTGAGAGKMPTVAAAGGGPGMVWVNTASKVYHCPTDRYYGKTKAGKYVSESAALAEGDKPDAGKKCN